jgi:hypothetical protein
VSILLAQCVLRQRGNCYRPWWAMFLASLLMLPDVFTKAYPYVAFRTMIVAPFADAAFRFYRTVQTLPRSVWFFPADAAWRIHKDLLIRRNPERPTPTWHR